MLEYCGYRIVLALDVCSRTLDCMVRLKGTKTKSKVDATISDTLFLRCEPFGPEAVCAKEMSRRKDRNCFDGLGNNHARLGPSSIRRNYLWTDDE